MNIVIEPLEEKDIKEGKKLITEVVKDNFEYEGLSINKFKEEILNELETQNQRLIAYSKNKFPYFITAKIRNKIVGIIAFGPVNNVIEVGLKKINQKNKSIVSLMSAYIKPSYQGQGIGTRLVMEIIKILKNSQYQFVSLDTGYKKGKYFWTKKFGLPTVILKKHYNNTADCLIWVKKISEL